MKPFDLERALAGDKVVTRDGREVTQLTKFNSDADCLAAVVDGELITWGEDGLYWVKGRDSGFDLFMAPKTVKRWVNFYSPEAGAWDYETPEKAKECARPEAIAIAVPVEFEEGLGIEVSK